jgi:hypothetical protein
MRNWLIIMVNGPQGTNREVRYIAVYTDDPDMAESMGHVATNHMDGFYVEAVEPLE